MQESNRQFTIYLAHAATDAMPAGFREAATAPGITPFGLSAAAAAALPAGAPPCPDGGMYCWSLNWNVWEGPPTLPIYPAAVSAGPTGTGSGASPGALPARTYNISLDLGDVVDLALINPSRMVHPMHLHGGSFWVLAAGVGDILDSSSFRVSAAAAEGYNLDNPPYRDTVPVHQAVGPAPSNNGSASSDGGTASGDTGGDTGGDMGGMDHMGHGLRRLLQGSAEGSGNGNGTGPGFAVLRFRADNPG